MPVTYAELKQELLEKRAELMEQLEDTPEGVQQDVVGYSNHMADAATEVFEQARDVGLNRQLRNSLAEVNHALEKFEDGTYGICEHCGAPIDLARLEARPEARYCLEDQSRLEASTREIRRRR